jgi:hypothetical protein
MTVSSGQTLGFECPFHTRPLALSLLDPVRCWAAVMSGRQRGVLVWTAQSSSAIFAEHMAMPISARCWRSQSGWRSLGKWSLIGSKWFRLPQRVSPGQTSELWAESLRSGYDYSLWKSNLLWSRTQSSFISSDDSSLKEVFTDFDSSKYTPFCFRTMSCRDVVLLTWDFCIFRFILGNESEFQIWRQFTLLRI